jgi:hypothetical protein
MGKESYERANCASRSLTKRSTFACNGGATVGMGGEVRKAHWSMEGKRVMGDVRKLIDHTNLAV